jgi:hypothetical protein
MKVIPEYALTTVIAIIVATVSAGQVMADGQVVQMKQGVEIYLTFQRCNKVTMEPVHYKNRYGTTLGRHMFLPNDLDRSAEYPALIIVEDFSAGEDYLGTLPFVDREKIGAIGICGSGGFALTAAQVDHRNKAVRSDAGSAWSAAMG